MELPLTKLLESKHKEPIDRLGKSYVDDQILSTWFPLKKVGADIMWVNEIAQCKCLISMF